MNITDCSLHLKNVSYLKKEKAESKESKSLSAMHNLLIYKCAEIGESTII